MYHEITLNNQPYGSLKHMYISSVTMVVSADFMKLSQLWIQMGSLLIKSLVGRYFKEYLRPTQQSYMLGYQKVVLALLQLLLVPTVRSGYDSHHYIGCFCISCFPYLLTAFCVLWALLQTSDRDEKMICYIVNTAEYCHQTVSLLYF
jgi:hypothetical protein